MAPAGLPDRAHLYELTMKIRKQTEHAARKAREQVEREEKERAAIVLEFSKQSASEYIAKQIMEAVNNGNFGCTYIFGEKAPESELVAFLLDHFKDYSPKVVGVQEQEILNYEMGTVRWYYAHALSIYWGHA